MRISVIGHRLRDVESPLITIEGRGIEEGAHSNLSVVLYHLSIMRMCLLCRRVREIPELLIVSLLG